MVIIPPNCRTSSFLVLAFRWRIGRVNFSLVILLTKEQLETFLGPNEWEPPSSPLYQINDCLSLVICLHFSVASYFLSFHHWPAPVLLFLHSLCSEDNCPTLQARICIPKLASILSAYQSLLLYLRQFFILSFISIHMCRFFCFAKYISCQLCSLLKHQCLKRLLVRAYWSSHE